MPIKTDFIDFEREKAEDCATTQNQTKGAVSEVAQTESERVGLPQYWRLAKDPREVRAIFRFILADRRVRVQRPRLMVVRPPSSGSAQCDGAEARVEFFEGHDEIERSDQIRSPAQPADESPNWMEPNEQTYDSAEFLAEVSRRGTGLANPRARRLSTRTPQGQRRTLRSNLFRGSQAIPWHPRPCLIAGFHNGAGNENTECLTV